jgi:hypothetical protein
VDHAVAAYSEGQSRTPAKICRDALIYWGSKASSGQPKIVSMETLFPQAANEKEVCQPVKEWPNQAKR